MLYCDPINLEMYGKKLINKLQPVFNIVHTGHTKGTMIRYLRAIEKSLEKQVRFIKELEKMQKRTHRFLFMRFLSIFFPVYSIIGI